MSARIVFLLALLVFAISTKGDGWPAPSGGATHAHAAVATDQSKNPTSSATTAGPLGDHYLMLVNTAISWMMTPEKMAEFNNSPYDGLAIAFWHAYDTSAPVPVADMDAQIARWKKVTKKDIWPWIYINRMIAADDVQHNAHADVPYFHRFKGADLDDQAGAQSDFLANWKNSLRTAKDMHVAGVVCDLEFYNYYKQYDPGELARQTGKSPEQVVALLRGVGAKMADIAATQYPNAVLWFLFTGFTHPGYKTINNQPYYPSPTYVAMGLLDEIQTRHFGLKVISGGEGSLAYCHHTLQDFQAAIQKRGLDFAPQLQKYSGILALGGTMTMWSDPSAKRDWALQGECATASAATAEDFEPYLELLLTFYRYNWIWGSPDGGYYAFEPDSARRFNGVIRKAEARVSGNQPR